MTGTGAVQLQTVGVGGAGAEGHETALAARIASSRPSTNLPASALA